MLTNLLRWVQTDLMQSLGLRALFRSQKGGFVRPVILSRAEHPISRRQISSQALKVLYRLQESGHQAYVGGGAIRNLWLGFHPKDFDVVTDARPEEVVRLFKNSRLIGRRFKLVHVHFGRQIIEVATFRSTPPEEDDHKSSVDSAADQTGMIMRDNVFGTLAEDAFRRDCTINALYYNIADSSLIDYVDGLSDLNAGIIRIIGDPIKRYREDPVRMLRAIRFAAQLRFSIDPDTERPLFELRHLLNHVPSARLFDEYLKLFLGGSAKASFDLLRQYGFFAVLFPKTDRLLMTHPNQALIAEFIQIALYDTDERVAAHKPVSSHFLLAVFFWYAVVAEAEVQHALSVSETAAFYLACDEVLQDSNSVFSIPKRLKQTIKEIWILQLRLKKRSGHRAAQMHAHPRFRAAYDLLVLRAKALDPEAKSLAQWWTTYLDADETVRTLLTSSIKNEGQRRRKKQKRIRQSQVNSKEDLS